MQNVIRVLNAVAFTLVIAFGLYALLFVFNVIEIIRSKKTGILRWHLWEKKTKRLFLNPKDIFSCLEYPLPVVLRSEGKSVWNSTRFDAANEPIRLEIDAISFHSPLDCKRVKGTAIIRVISPDVSCKNDDYVDEVLACIVHERTRTQIVRTFANARGFDVEFKPTEAE